MVQKRVQKATQAENGGSEVKDDNAMPQFMFKSPRGNGYLFRRAVPADVRAVIGKREFKFVLGGDHRSASQRCRELAVETDKQILAARAGGTASAVIHDTEQLAIPQNRPLGEIKEVSQDLIEQLGATVTEQVLSAYRERRYRASGALDVDKDVRDLERTRTWADMAWQGHDVAVRGWANMLTSTLSRSGYRLADELAGTQQERVLLMEYARAYRDGLDLVKADYFGGPRTTSASSSPPDSAPGLRASAAEQLMLSKAVEEFLHNLPPMKEMRAKHEVVLPAFIEVTGDLPVSSLRQSHINHFLRLCQKLPPRWVELRKKTGQTVTALAESSAEHLAKATYERTYRTSISSFLKTSAREWQDIGFPSSLTATEPYKGPRVRREFKQRALRPTEIEALFRNDHMEKMVSNPAQVHKYWLLVIELYTGARVREICQINPQSDYGYDDGIWWVSFNDRDGHAPDVQVSKSIKTGDSRTVPLHPELVRLGLPNYLQKLKAAGARRLFPQWAPTDGNAGAAPAKWVTNYLKRIGLHGVANEIGNALRGSHAFRHTLLTYGRRNGVNLRCVSGHKEVSDNPVADGYEDESLLVPLAEKARRLEKLDYGVMLPMPVAAMVRGE